MIIKNIKLLCSVMFIGGVLLLSNGCDNQGMDNVKSVSKEKPSVTAEVPQKNIFTENITDISDNVIGFWQFNNPTNKLKDSSSFHNDLSRSGKPAFTNGTVFLHGGKWRQPDTDREYLYSKSKDFDLGNNSFTVECWFKSPVITYMKLVGTRSTIRSGYPSQRGWALGVSKGDGKVMFIVNDNKQKKVYAGVQIGESAWDGDEWNYLVGVRDITKKEVRLYLNGELVDRKPDICGDIKGGRFTLGYDSYAGSLTEGYYGSVKITKDIVSEDSISKEYARVVPPVSDKDKIFVKNDASVPDNIKIDLTDGLNGKLNLQPLPVELKYSKKYITLQEPVYIQLPAEPTSQQLTAEKILVSDFKSHLKVDVVKLSAGKNIDAGTVIKLSKAAPRDNAESYHLNVNGKSGVIELSSGDHGIIYGALTFMQIIEQATLTKDGELSIPEHVSIYDYPATAHRIQVRLLSKNLTDSDANIHKIMMRIARSRLNYYTINPADPTAENIKRLVDIADQYGVSVMATVGYLWRSRGLKRSLTMDDMINYVNKDYAKAAEAGCKGFSFHFDDLGHYAKLAADFPGGVGAFQRQFLVEMQKTAKKYNISFLSICPTMYMRHWPSSAKTWFGDPAKYKNYFEEVSHLPGGDIELFYTDIVGVNDLRKRGVRKPAYYLNGVWGSKRMLGVYAGPARLTWSWYGFDVDPVKGPVLVPETMVAWKNLAKDKINSVWVGAGGLGGPMVAGIWMWNPAAFDENAALKEVNREISIGAGTFNALLAYENNILPLVALFKTYVNSWTSEFHVKTLERKRPLDTDDLIVYWNNYLAAEKAFETIKVIIAETDGKVYRTWRYKNVLNDMQQSLDLFRAKLIMKMERKGIFLNDEG